jgi:hypothetical protein
MIYKIKAHKNIPTQSKNTKLINIKINIKIAKKGSIIVCPFDPSFNALRSVLPSSELPISELPISELPASVLPASVLSISELHVFFDSKNVPIFLINAINNSHKKNIL